VQRAGESLQETIAVRESAMVVVVVMVGFIAVVASLLQERRGMSRGKTTVHKSTIMVVVIVVGVIVVLSLLLQGVREGVGKAKLSHILRMSSFSCWRLCHCGGRAMEM